MISSCDITAQEESPDVRREPLSIWQGTPDIWEGKYEGATYTYTISRQEEDTMGREEEEKRYRNQLYIETNFVANMRCREVEGLLNCWGQFPNQVSYNIKIGYEDGRYIARWPNNLSIALNKLQ